MVPIPPFYPHEFPSISETRWRKGGKGGSFDRFPFDRPLTDIVFGRFMKIITRYILSRILAIFTISLLLMTSVVTLFVISEATVKRGLPLYLAVRLIPCYMPYLLSITMPVASLLSCTLFYAKMVGSNEIIALKSMGVPPWRIFLPAWVATFIISLLTIWCNDLNFSWGRKEMARRIISGTEETILGKLAADGKFSDAENNFVLNVGQVSKTGELKKVSFLTSKPPLKGEAESGHLDVDFSRSTPVLRIELNDLLVTEGTNMFVQPGKQVREIPLDQFNFGSLGRSDPAMKEVRQTLKEIQAERDRLLRKTSVKGAFALMKGDFDYFRDNDWIDRLYNDQDLEYRYNRSNLVIPRCLASGFTCFFFTWVGIPLAIWLNCSDYFTSFFVSFLPTLVIYYPLLMFGLSGAKSGIFNPWVCWIGNVVLGLIGFWILKKIHRH